MTTDPAPSPQRPEPDRPTMLDRMLDWTEQSESMVANPIMIAIIVTASGLLSLGLTALILPLTGLPPSRPIFALVAIIGTVVPFVVGLPAVLFGDALVRKIQGMREELRGALAEATLASRAKSEFLANISHEIRTPMNGVLGMAQVLETTPLSDLQRENLRLIRDSGHLLMAIIDDVLDLSRIETGRIDLHPAPHPLVSSLADTVALFQARAQENGTVLSFVADPGTPEMAVFDSVRVRQCLGNLVSNAVKFTHQGAVTVTLATRPQADGALLVAVRVEDTGIGIDAAAQGRLFVAFSQGDSSITQQYGGSGLGLAISRRLARMMGGDITVSSVPGQGSCFTLEFLARTVAGQGAEATPSAPDPAQPSLAGVRILVVDDSVVNRRVAAGLLSPMGATCVEAEGGQEALALMAEQPVDLVLLDMQMPGMDGAETLHALRGSAQPWAQVPVVALTASALPEERARALGMGMQGYVTKPVRRDLLRAEIARSLGLPA